MHFNWASSRENLSSRFPKKLVGVFSDVLVAFLYFDICHYQVANIKIWKSHLNIREGSDYEKASFKTVSSATQTGYKIENSLVASLHMILSAKRITKALIRLRGCAGCSAPVLFANPRRQVFSRRGPIIF